MKRTNKSDRLIQILDYFDTLAPGERVLQDRILKDLKINRGQWNNIRNLLELIIQIQARPIEREFKRVKKDGVRTVTVYYRE
jgi:hypothetical protein